VVEGCGDHGCEYMTQGVAVVLGPTGRNFAAGMSGGVAYVLDLDGGFPDRLNRGMAGLERLEDITDQELVRALIERHERLTDSQRAAWILANWSAQRERFWKVVPHPGQEEKGEKDQQTGELKVEALRALIAEKVSDERRA
jgi:glutamate synthase domain-containing protein 3